MAEGARRPTDSGADDTELCAFRRWAFLSRSLRCHASYHLARLDPVFWLTTGRGGGWLGDPWLARMAKLFPGGAEGLDLRGLLDVEPAA
jgi:hypothetical protein